jgi:hypothetical protein
VSAGRVLEIKETDGSIDQLIRYRFEGIDVEGWADHPLLEGEVEPSCARLIDKTRFLRFDLLDEDPMTERWPLISGFVPNGFVPAGKQLPQVLAEAFQHHRTLFVPVIRNAKLECAGYRTGRYKGGAGYMVAIQPPDPDTLRLEYGLGVSPDHLGVSGPTAKLRHGGSITAGCLHEFQFLRADSGRIEIIPTTGQVASYHPDDIEVWYADQNICREHATFKQVSTACK